MKIIIFCGGYGTRMWPASRKSNPKQFYPLIKDKSFFQITIERFKKAFPITDILVSTESRYVDFVKKQAPDLPIDNIISEPDRKDTLASIGLATSIVHKKYGNETIVASWSDHIIDDEEIFLKAVKVASDFAEKTSLIVSVDQVPEFASIHHGWVKRGDFIEKYGDFDIFKIVKHVEKPAKEIADVMFAEGDWLLNTGYRAWRSDTLLSFYKDLEPEMYKSFEKIVSFYGTDDFERVLGEEYSKLRKDSIEFGIFEKLDADKRAVLPVSMKWKDAGTWHLFYNALSKEKNENIFDGKYFTQISSEGNLIISKTNRPVVTIGVSGKVIIDTDDGLLVADMNMTDKVKEIFSILEKEHPEFVE